MEQKPKNSEVRKPAESFRDLIVWQKAHALVLEIYRLSDPFPAREIYGLAAQVRSSSDSVPANIAEAWKKRSKADKARVLNIAQGSLEETRYFVILGHDLKYWDQNRLMPQVEEVSKMLDSDTRKVLGWEF